MARIKAIPAMAVVKSLGGVLDFAVWRGRPYVRKWPQWKGRKRSDKVLAQIAKFTAVGRAVSETDPALRDILTAELEGFGWTWKDAMMAWAFGKNWESVLLVMNMPFTYLEAATAITLLNNNYQPITWPNAPTNDGIGMWLVSAPTKFTIPITGFYFIFSRYAHGAGAWTSAIDIRINGSTTIAGELWNAAAGQPHAAAQILAPVHLHTGDYFEVMYFQASGSSRSTIDARVCVLQMGTG